MASSLSPPWRKPSKEQLVPSSLPPPGAVGENSSTDHILSSICPNWFLPQEKWVWQASRALRGHEAPRVLKEREGPPVNVEPPGMLGRQVSDGRSEGRAPVPLCPPGTVDDHPPTTTYHIRADMTGLGRGGVGSAEIYVQGG